MSIWGEQWPGSEAQVQRMIQVGANAWMKEKGLVTDRDLSSKVKGKVMVFLYYQPALMVWR